MINAAKVIADISFERFKYPILVIILGVILMLLPTGGSSKQDKNVNEPTVSQILSSTSGVGECIVLISDKGVVVVCEGADNAKVRLEIIHALSSYTGYSSDKITILKMAE